MDQARKMDVRLTHHVEVSEALNCLVQQLQCNSWYVACHHNHLFVFRLATGSTDKFAVSFECTAPVEKGVYHGSKASALSITPLHGQRPLTAEELNRIQIALNQSMNQ